MSGEDWLLGTGDQLQRYEAGLDEEASGDAPMSVGSALAVPCRASQISSCLSWMSRQEEFFLNVDRCVWSADPLFARHYPQNRE